MQKIIRTFFALSILLLTITFQAFALEDITEINYLIENAKQLDNKTVTIQGEAIGECMERGDYCWVNINDNTNAIGVWIKYENAKQIKKYGDYKNKGDILSINGVFRRACAEHGGEADIHSRDMQIIKSGYAVKENISFVKLIIALTLSIVLIAAISIIHKYKIIKLPYHF